MPGFFGRQRRLLEERLSKSGRAHTLSLARYSLHQELTHAIREHAAGRALDIGAGHSPYLAALRDRCESVLSMDLERRGEDTNLRGSVLDLPFADGGIFDTVFCTQVLEHVPQPARAVSEMSRVLAPGGKLILSVPHLSVIHEAPHDYFRYTRYGLEGLLADAGLRVESIRESGGLLSFLGHGASCILMSLAAPLPGLRWLAWLFNYVFWVRLAQVLDRLLGFSSLYPCNYVVVAVKE